MELYLTEKVRLGYRTGELIRMAAFALLGVIIAASVFEVDLEFDLGSVLAELFMLSMGVLCIWKGTLGPVRRQSASRLPIGLRNASSPALSQRFPLTSFPEPLAERTWNVRYAI